MSMAELTNFWLNTVVGEEGFCFPKVWIPKSYLGPAERFCENLRNNGAERIIVVNFGVGGNLRKRVGRRLEEKVIILDKGYGEEEEANTDSLIGAIEDHGHLVYHTTFGSERHEKMSSGLIGVTSRIVEIANLMSS
jgi:hypothetical protein